MKKPRLYRVDFWFIVDIEDPEKRDARDAVERAWKGLREKPAGFQVRPYREKRDGAAQPEQCSCHSGSVCGKACAAGRHHDGCVAGQPEQVREVHEETTLTYRHSRPRPGEAVAMLERLQEPELDAAAQPEEEV